MAASEQASEPGAHGARAGRALLLLAGAGAAFVLTVLVSTVLAHPAGAAVLPTPSAAPVPGANPSLTLPLGTQSSVGQASPSGGTSLPPPAPTASPAPSSGVDLHGLLSPVQRAAELAPPPVLDVVTAGAAGATALVSGGPIPGISTARSGRAGDPPETAPLGPAQLLGPHSPVAADTVTGRFLGISVRPSGTFGPPHRGPTAPGPPLAPVVLQHVTPLTTNDSGNPSPSGSGGTPLGSLSPSGLLMPAALAGGALLAATRARRLLLDLRYSPPG
jgi:hypothetical protein